MTQSHFNFKNRSVGALVSAAILTLAMATTATACDSPSKVLDKLNLTSEQRDQVGEILSNKRQQKKSMRVQRKALQQKQVELAENYSEVLALKVAAQAGELASQTMLGKINSQQKILRILTNEQKQTFINMMAEKQHKRLCRPDMEGKLNSRA